MELPNSTGQGDPHIRPLRFYHEYEDVPGKPGEPREVEWCEWVKVGGNGATTNEKVARLQKTDLWPFLERAYAAWKKGQEEPTDGTPLAAWAGVNAAQGQFAAQALREAEHVHDFHIGIADDGRRDAKFHFLGRVLNDR